MPTIKESRLHTLSSLLEDVDWRQHHLWTDIAYRFIWLDPREQLITDKLPLSPIPSKMSVRPSWFLQHQFYKSVRWLLWIVVNWSELYSLLSLVVLIQCRTYSHFVLAIVEIFLVLNLEDQNLQLRYLWKMIKFRGFNPNFQSGVQTINLDRNFKYPHKNLS